jgi:predicted nucleic acid-binding protein
LIILDTDITSAFAKVSAIDTLVDLMSKHHEVCITPKLYEELQIPLSFGYDFPKRIFARVRVLDLSPQEQRDYRVLLEQFPTIGRGELEAIVVCKRRSGVFSSLDRQALRVAASQGIPTLPLGAILIEFLKRRVYSKAELRALIQEINRVDKRQIDFDALGLP